MNYGYADLKTLEEFLKKSRETFSDKSHTHVTSDITGLSDILDGLVEKNVYEGIKNFPSIGKPGNIYIDSLANKTYRWDDENLKYYCIGSDYSEIDLITGGASE